MINSFHPNYHFLQVRWLRENWHLIPAGKTLAPVAASFYELMTAPTTKVRSRFCLLTINIRKACSITGVLNNPTEKAQCNSYVWRKRKPFYQNAVFVLKYDLRPSRSWRNGLSRNRWRRPWPLTPALVRSISCNRRWMFRYWCIIVKNQNVVLMVDDRYIYISLMTVIRSHDIPWHPWFRVSPSS